LNHTEWFQDIRFDNLIFGYNISKKLGLGVGFTHMWMPGIEGLDETGLPGPTVNVSSSVVILGLSYRINYAISFGVAAKYFQDKLADYATSGASFDFGLYMKTAVPGLSLGIAAQNLGGEIKYDVQSQKIPLTYRGGLAYKFRSTDVLFSIDAVKAHDTDIFMNLGVEYVFRKQFSLRIGNKSYGSELFSPSFGAGFHIKETYHLQYTFVNYSDLGTTHRLGFSFHFNRPSTIRTSRLQYDTSQPVQLVPPENLTVQVDDAQLHVSWDRVTGVQYNVYAKHSSQDKWIKLNKKPLYNNSMNFKKPVTLGRYNFRVSSQYQSKESGYSKEKSIDIK
jgi:hypothetical protein